MKPFTIIVLLSVSAVALSFYKVEVEMEVSHSLTIDSLGACQGISYQNGRVFLYGDREVGMIREGIAVTSSRKDNVHLVNVNF